MVSLPIKYLFEGIPWRSRGFRSGSMVKNLPTVQEMQVQFLGREDPLEEEMATNSSILAGKIPWTEEPGWQQFHRVTKSWMWLNYWTTHACRAVQCLGLHTFSAKSLGSIPDPETKIPQTSQCGQIRGKSIWETGFEISLLECTFTASDWMVKI